MRAGTVFCLNTVAAGSVQSGKIQFKNARYYHKLSAALQQTVADCVRAGVADGRITELRQIVAEQARLEQEFGEKLKGVYV